MRYRVHETIADEKPTYVFAHDSNDKNRQAAAYWKEDHQEFAKLDNDIYKECLRKLHRQGELTGVTEQALAIGTSGEEIDYEHTVMDQMGKVNPDLMIDKAHCYKQSTELVDHHFFEQQQFRSYRIIDSD